MKFIFNHVDQMDWYGADVVMMLETVGAKDCCGLIMDAKYQLKNWYFEDVKEDVETSKPEFDIGVFSFFF